MENREQRLFNMDLLRVICSVFVIIEHFCETNGCNAFGYSLESMSVLSYPMLRIIYSIARVAVPCFIILSGYFSIYSTKQKFRKVVSLTLTVIAYSMITYFVGIIFGSNPVSLKNILFIFLPQNYYLYLFLTLYLLSPYINRLIAELNQKQYHRMLLILVFAFVIWSTVINTLCGLFDMQLTGVYATGRTTTDMGFNICNFITLYLLGGYMRKYPISLSKNGKLLSFAVISVCVLITSMSEIIFADYAVDLLSYDSMFVVLQSVLIVMIFSNVKVSSKPIITFAANNTFGIYLIHWYFLTFFANRIFYAEKFIKSGFGGCIMISLATIICAYICSLTFSALFNFAVKPLSKRFNKTKIAGARIFIDG